MILRRFRFTIRDWFWCCFVIGLVCIYFLDSFDDKQGGLVYLVWGYR